MNISRNSYIIPAYIIMIIMIIMMAIGNVQAAAGAGCVSGANQSAAHKGHEGPLGVKVVDWNWSHVGVYFTITVFIVLSGLAKVGFHYAHFISSRIPESCLLIIVGIVMGVIIFFGLEDSEKSENFVFPRFTPTLFFFVLLPSIILESAFSLYDRAFFDNLATILVMAVIGTAVNFLLIGGLLFAAFYLGAMGKMAWPFDIMDVNQNNQTIQFYDLNILEIMLFSSLISAVDPVAVLNIFQEVGVNPDLYFMVFGESLLNDGVAVVLYNMMKTFNEMNQAKVAIDFIQVLLGLASFFTISLGGLVIGIIVGFITALITKTTTDVRVVEPLAIFGMAYLAFVTAELFHWSGIISLIGCGLVQAHYAFKNISKKSYTTVKYFIKMLSSTSDCIIFLFLGIALVRENHYWHMGFVLWTCVLCLVCRFIGVYALSWLVNQRRLKRVNLQEQFIMAYGGLRGAVGFSLVEMINQDVVPPRQLFLTTTLAVIMFTVFFQGGTIKLLVNLLGIDKKSNDGRMICEEVNDNVIEHLMAGIEIISGKRGALYLGNRLSQLDEKYLMRWFCSSDSEHHLTRLYEKLCLADHVCNLYGPTILHEEKKAGLYMKTVDEDALPLMPADPSEPRMFASRRRKRRASRSLSTHPDHILLISSDPDRPTTPPPPPPPPSSAHRLSMMMDFSFGLSRSPPSRRTNREDLQYVRSAFRQAPFQRLHQKHNPNLIDDEEQELSAHLRRRHLNARTISQFALQSQEGNKILPVLEARTRHISMIDEGSDTTLLENLLTVPEGDRPGVKAVIDRHNQRVRSMSVSACSSRRRMQSEAGMSDSGSPPEVKEAHNHPEPAAAKRPGAPKRKQTPHPIDPSKLPLAVMKLSTLEENEEHGSKAPDN